MFSRTNKDRQKFSFSLLTIILLSILGLVSLVLLATDNHAQRDGNDDYSVKLNSTILEQTTDGKNPVDYSLIITNEGRQIDTFNIFAELLEVSGCNEPDLTEWSHSLDISVVTLGPQQSAPITLTITSSCSCQIGCIATVTVYAVSGGEPSVRDSLITNTTRGTPNQISGLVVEADFNQLLNPIFIEKSMTYDIIIYNYRSQKDNIIIWTNSGPINWSISFSPEEFSISSRGKFTTTMTIKIPKNTPEGDYSITIIAQSISSPNVQDKDIIQISVKPDIEIENITFSKLKLHANEKVSIRIMLKNIGLAPAENVQISIYDALDLSPNHLLSSQSIIRLDPNQWTNISYNWNPDKGDYNITVLMDPDDAVEELREDNNLFFASVNVGSAKDSDSGKQQQFLVFLIVSIIIILLILVFRYARVKGTHEQEEDLDIEVGKGKGTTKIPHPQKVHKSSTYKQRENRQRPKTRSQVIINTFHAKKNLSEKYIEDKKNL